MSIFFRQMDGSSVPVASCARGGGQAGATRTVPPSRGREIRPPDEEGGSYKSTRHCPHAGGKLTVRPRLILTYTN